MKNPVYEGLTTEQSHLIRFELDQALARGPKGEFDSEHVIKRNDEYLVQIRAWYPTSMFEFMQALATAEISLRDSGLNVRLIPRCPSGG